ncbi:hypothetical protein BDA96_09G238700 [Sorghum bicolor]|uniref:Non-haem dioxygenase N-terminal domain-containing protein n=2 Tax=Sorghum bicolor TaxID=4558 RepID=A0A921QCE0_SORBI|nr:hypothetical protein BDA96_09G238700 [Sorghum bicolor]KXG22510.1 hypothetical protein SORBI_3009G226100 [Sorghum bicolor]
MPPSTGEQHSDDRSAQPEAGERRAQRSIESKLVAGRSGRDLGHGHRRRQSRDQAVRRRAMALQPPPSVHAVTIPFADLRDRSKDLSGFIEEGFGPRGLGIVSITDVPGYPELRRRLLRLAPRIVNLPDDVKKQLEDPDSSYHFGWSRAEEKFESGRWDTPKGSYFANPVFDVPTTDDELVTRYPSYCRPNIWPTDHLLSLK